LSKEKI